MTPIACVGACTAVQEGTTSEQRPSLRFERQDGAWHEWTTGDPNLRHVSVAQLETGS